MSLNLQTADTLRTYVTNNIRWAHQYQSAVDNTINSSTDDNPNSPSPSIEFADVSRANDGPVLGEMLRHQPSNRPHNRGDIFSEVVFSTTSLLNFSHARSGACPKVLSHVPLEIVTAGQTDLAAMKSIQ